VKACLVLLCSVVVHHLEALGRGDDGNFYIMITIFLLLGKIGTVVLIANNTDYYTRIKSRITINNNNNRTGMRHEQAYRRTIELDDMNKPTGERLNWMSHQLHDIVALVS
jgi:hypothetical protein